MECRASGSGNVTHVDAMFAVVPEAVTTVRIIVVERQGNLRRDQFHEREE
jgi:hypothetical protein